MYGVSFTTFCPVSTICTQAYSCAMMLQRSGCGKGLKVVSSCQVPRSFSGLLPDLCPQDPIREQGPRIQRCQFHFPQLTLLLTKSRSYYTTSSRIPRRPQTNGVWCSTGFPAVQPSMKHVTRASIEKYVICGPNFYFRVHPHSWHLAVEILVHCNYSRSE